jgi:light-regulated signal transduction histidine kinase (bacteriophytochrome)
VAIALVGLADYLTGIEVSLEIFYVIPVYFVAWTVSRTAGIVLAVAAALTWLAADRAAGHVYVWVQTPYWNTLGGFLVFTVIALAASGSRAWLQEMKATRNALARKTRELARSNADLEQFASVAAHDLKSPLVAVGGYVQLLRRRLSERLDPEAASYLGRAAEGVVRMENLIEDLLAYARVAAEDREPESVEVADALEEALQNLAAEIEDCGGSVTRDRLPVVAGHRREVVQLFQNLVGNALKFRGEEPPKVHVGADEGPDGWEIYIQDDGIGIEPAEAEKIFQLFARLHGRNQYPGTGVGLAICKKIVEARGGRIWVESEPGKGATFRFTLSPPRKA